jgi:hypothetical protein
MTERTLTPADRQHLIDEYHRIYPGFITVFIADHTGVVHQIAPLRESPGINDRKYFTEAMQTRQMAVSDVILGRLSNFPIVTIELPIVRAIGEVGGVAGARLICRSSSGSSTITRRWPTRASPSSISTTARSTERPDRFPAQDLAKDDLVVASTRAGRRARTSGASPIRTDRGGSSQRADAVGRLEGSSSSRC